MLIISACPLCAHSTLQYTAQLSCTTVRSIPKVTLFYRHVALRDVQLCKRYAQTSDHSQISLPASSSPAQTLCFAIFLASSFLYSWIEPS